MAKKQPMKDHAPLSRRVPLAIDPRYRNEKTDAELNRIEDPERGLTLNQEYDLVEASLREAAKRAVDKERAAFLDAFTLGDDLDDERAVRAAGLLLEWGFGEHAGRGGNDKDNLARGIGGALSLIADQVARIQRRFTALKEKTGNADW